MNKPISIIVGSRSSKLALKQVQEVLEGIRYHHPKISFRFKCGVSRGDKDQKTSLRDLGPTDFFTYELDQWLLNQSCRITIHSAKDLPDPLPKGIKIVAITQNQNNEDVLVLKPFKKLSSLPSNLKIGVSSQRREEGVSKLFPYAKCYDLRGTIEKRIEKVTIGELDGVAIAKVALMRLNLMHLPQLELPIKPPAMQGSLAILARDDDEEMASIFSSIDIRQANKSLFLGLDPSKFLSSGEVFHYPMIKICSRPKSELLPTFFDFHEYSHLLLTSKSSVKILFECLDRLQKPYSLLNTKKVIAIGRATAEYLMKEGIYVDHIPQIESQEGLMALFGKLKISSKDRILYPRSSKARANLVEYFTQNEIPFVAPCFYDTLDYLPDPKPNIEDFDEIVFTSPSIVNSFFNHFSLPEKEVKLIFKGEVTKDYFKSIQLVN